jgi:hypothetical protein
MWLRGAAETIDSVRRAALYVLVGSIALNAALGIYAIVAGNFGKLEVKILLTSLGVSGASILALACAPALERHLLGPVPRWGIAASFAGLALLTAAVWDEFDLQPLVKAAGTLVVVAVASAHASLLSLAGLAPRFRWAFLAAVGLGFAFSGLAVSLIWGEWSDSAVFGRSFGVVAVLLAAFTILVPVLHRASREELAALAAETISSVQFCPSCGWPVAAGADGAGTCARCGARFSVQFLDSGAAARPVPGEPAVKLRSRASTPPRR